MKKILIILGLATISARAGFISSYPNTNSWLSTDLFIIERPGVTNFNIMMSQMAGAIGALTSGSSLDATKLTGTLPQSSFASFNLTNNWQGVITSKGLIISSGFTNNSPSIVGNSLTMFDANRNETILPNAVGVLVDNGSVPSYSASPTLNSITVTNLGDNAGSNFVFSATNGTLFYVSLGSGLTYNATTKSVSVTAGGSGTVTSVAATLPQGFSVSGSPVTTSGTLAITRNGGNDNLLGGGVTNAAMLTGTNNASPALVAGTTSGDGTNVFQVSALGRVRSGLMNTNGDWFFNGNLYLNGLGYLGGQQLATTNQLLNASALGASQFVKTDGTTNLVSTMDATGLTNSVSYTNYLAGTNIAAVFDGNNHMGTITNGPDVWITPSVAGNASGSWSWEVTTNVALHLPIPVRWLAGSNGISANVFSITNGEFDLSAYGGTNFPHLKAAIGENQ